jgi:peptidyl-prolyl cis-trans isomerase A (cyclophilin A)
MRIVLLLLLFVAFAFAEERPFGPPTGEPTAVIETSMGNLRCKLFPKEAPKTVANFVGLAEGTKDWKDPRTGQTKQGVPLYSGTIFHRVIPDFMIQGGDPLGTGTGDPGYRFEDEIVSSLTFDRPGRLAMANAGPGTNGSQFFITEKPTPWLNGHHTIFGQCDDASVELVKKIARVPKGPGDKPTTPVRINKIVIERGTAKPKTAKE